MFSFFFFFFNKFIANLSDSLTLHLAFSTYPTPENFVFLSNLSALEFYGNTLNCKNLISTKLRKYAEQLDE